MGKFKTFLGATERIYLPSTKVDEHGNPLPEAEWEWVELELRALTAADMFLVTDARNRTTVERDMLLPRIKSWSYQENDGTPAAITAFNVGRLDVEDFNMLVAKMDGAKTTQEEPLPAEETKSADEAPQGQ